VMRVCEKALPLVERVAEKGNKKSISDAGVAALVLGAAAAGAHLNVLINLPGLTNREDAARLQKDGAAILARVAKSTSQAAGRVTQALSS